MVQLQYCTKNIIKEQKTMKKIISLMLCLAMLLSVSAFALPVLDVAEKAEISETGTKATLSSETVTVYFTGDISTKFAPINANAGDIIDLSDYLDVELNALAKADHKRFNGWMPDGVEKNLTTSTVTVSDDDGDGKMELVALVNHDFNFALEANRNMWYGNRGAFSTTDKTIAIESVKGTSGHSTFASLQVADLRGLILGDLAAVHIEDAVCRMRAQQQRGVGGQARAGSGLPYAHDVRRYLGGAAGHGALPSRTGQGCSHFSRPGGRKPCRHLPRGNERRRRGLRLRGRHRARPFRLRGPVGAVGRQARRRAGHRQARPSPGRLAAGQARRRARGLPGARACPSSGGPACMLTRANNI